ncbi:RDD family protein [Arthrobacter bambusae]
MPVAAVARQTTEYVEVPGLGVVKLASIGQRALARVLDIVLVVIAVVAYIFIMLAAATAGSGATYSVSGMSPVGALVFIAVIAYMYEILMVSFWGRTVGKMLVGARIIRAADGMKPNFGNAFLRWLAPGLGALIPFLGQLGATLVLLSPTFDSSGRRQGWHDRMAGTLVVAAPRSVAPTRLRN